MPQSKGVPLNAANGDADGTLPAGNIGHSLGFTGAAAAADAGGGSCLTVNAGMCGSGIRAAAVAVPRPGVGATADAGGRSGPPLVTMRQY